MSVTLETINPSDNPNEGRTKINSNFETLANNSGQDSFSALTSTIISAATISASTIYSGSTNLYNIFLTSADGNDITRIQPGLNTYTGGTENLPTINITGGTFDSLTVTGNSSFQGLTATTLSATSIDATSISATSISAVSIVNIYKYTKRLTYTDINTNLSAGTVSVSAGDLGLAANQSAKFQPLSTEWHIFTDGTPFTGSDYIILRANTGAVTAFQVNTNEISGAGDIKMVGMTLPTVTSGSAIRLVPMMSYYMESGGVFAGGGVNCYIDVVMYYQKVNL